MRNVELGEAGKRRQNDILEGEGEVQGSGMTGIPRGKDDILIVTTLGPREYL